MSVLPPILLQKSKVATVRISGENLKREEIDDSYSVSRAPEVAYDFSLRRRGPSHLYTKTEPAALGNFDTFCKTTFATISANTGHAARPQSPQRRSFRETLTVLRRSRSAAMLW